MTEQRRTYVKEFDIIDIRGAAHKVILAGILDISKFPEKQTKEKSLVIKNKVVTTTITWDEPKVFKAFSIGLAITNPTDVYDFNKGVKIAEGRALKPSKRIGELFSETKGMLGEEMCLSILEQQKDFILNNKELFLKGIKLKHGEGLCGIAEATGYSGTVVTNTDPTVTVSDPKFVTLTK